MNTWKPISLLRKDKAATLIQEAISKICEANKEINLAMSAGAERHKFRADFNSLIHNAGELILEIEQLN